MFMVVAYDIADPKRLTRVAKVMKDYGLRRQKSIFEVNIRQAELWRMKRRIENVMEMREDGVKFFPLCECCADTLLVIGRQGTGTDEADFLVL